jgi:hypothetical protein
MSIRLISSAGNWKRGDVLRLGGGEQSAVSGSRC